LRAERIAEALGGRGHDVHVVAYHLGDTRAKAPYVLHRIARVAYGYRGPGPTWRKLVQLDPLLARRLHRLLGETEFDVIHAHHYEGLLVALAARPRRVPLVYDAHTMLETELPWYCRPGTRGMARAMGRILDRRLPPRAEGVAAASPFIAAALARHHPRPERVRCIPAGVEPDWFAAAPGPVTEDTVVYAGNLAPWQGIADLLECLGLARTRRPTLRLTIVTEDDFSPWEPLAHRLGIRDAVTLRHSGSGAVAPVLAQATVLVQPRRWSAGLPQKLLNYMAAGRPVVSYAGSAPLLEDGLTGVLAPDGDIGALADGILRCTEDPALASRLGAAARERAREFTWTRTADALEALFHDIVREARAS
jgi:glycosyltransferase involved in cell wall biosynthesis